MNLSELKNTVLMRRVTGLRKLLPANGAVTQGRYHGRAVTTLTPLSYPLRTGPPTLKTSRYSRKPVHITGAGHRSSWL